MDQLVSDLSSELPHIRLIHGLELAETHLPRDVRPRLIALPKSSEETSQLMTFCFKRQQTVVTLGGLTGLVNGTACDHNDIAISLQKMNRVEDIDRQSRTMTVQAGAPLQTIQEAAAAAGMFFPLDLGARGSATIGGNLATNAGGNRVIRYGMMREQVLGLEAIIADGTLVSSMSKIIKNNTGYDIKHLFVGSEGTLGIVTRLVLKLRPAPISQDMAFVAVNHFDKVTELLNLVDSHLGGSLSAFEVLWQDFYQLVTRPPALGRPPIQGDYPYYVLIETLGGNISSDKTRFIEVLELALEQGLIEDAAIANSQGECDAMWAIRDDVGQVAQLAPILTFDISVSLDQMASYVEQTKSSLDKQWPDNRCMIFGHLGDGNLHIIVSTGETSPSTKEAVAHTIYAGLSTRHGSISAEHGIGLQKRDQLSLSRSRVEIDIMKSIKLALDPNQLLNPGKIFAL